MIEKIGDEVRITRPSKKKTVSRFLKCAYNREHVKSGKVTRAYRQWDIPRIKKGSTLLTPIGQLQFTQILVKQRSDLTREDALLSGHKSLDELLDGLSQRTGKKVFEIHFVFLGADPRISLREKTYIEREELKLILDKLKRFDQANKLGAWTQRTLQFDQAKLKLNIRKLKNLGLTISLGTGYKLSPRGRAILKSLSKKAKTF